MKILTFIMFMLPLAAYAQPVDIYKANNCNNQFHKFAYIEYANRNDNNSDGMNAAQVNGLSLQNDFRGIEYFSQGGSMTRQMLKINDERLLPIYFLNQVVSYRQSPNCQECDYVDVLSASEHKITFTTDKTFDLFRTEYRQEFDTTPSGPAIDPAIVEKFKKTWELIERPEREKNASLYSCEYVFYKTVD